MSEPCFHCHLPVPHNTDWHYPVLGEKRHFCCAGCRAVCKTIVENGLQDYYRHRTEAPQPADPVPDFLSGIGLYDHPEVQKGFVRQDGDTRQADLVLEGIQCASCVWLNEQQLRHQPGIISVDADYISQRMSVRWDATQTRLSDILQAIAAIGYFAYPYDAAHREALQRDQKTRTGNRILFAAALGMPVMQFSLAGYWLEVSAMAELPLWVEIGRWMMMLAVSAILAYPGQEFFLAAWRDLRNQRLGMDVPITLGLCIAWSASLYATFTGRGEVYFDSLAMFVLFLLIARAYELRGRRTAADLLDRLNRVIPQQVNRVTPHGLHKTPVVELQPGDRIELHIGDISPADGAIAQGESTFDESILSGESIPVSKQAGDQVIAGSRNLSQNIELVIQQVGAQSTLNEIQNLVRSGLNSGSRQKLLAERVVAWFVPAILLIALASLAWWLHQDPAQAVHNTVAILIVSCPCALALATPVVNVIAAGRFVAMGIVPLRIGAMELLANVKSALFDKTGTLTNGQFELLECVPFGQADCDQAKQIAAALETGNPHPLASAFAQTPHQIAYEQHRQIPGQGVQAIIENAEWRLGKPAFAIDQAHLSDWRQTIRTHQQQGRHCLVLSRQKQPYALFVLQDALRENALELVADLPRLGIRHHALISGDQAASVRLMQQRLGLTLAFSEMSAHDKLDWLKQNNPLPAPRLMVGDGVNDAPTLAAAEVSFSFADATRLAQYHSDFLLLGQSLKPVAQAIEMAKTARRRIQQNYAWAIGYNLIAIPLAFSGQIPPWAAALGMSLSSLIVVFNSLRLGR